jgi:4-carboxymuconolactone decarboxylase
MKFLTATIAVLAAAVTAHAQEARHMPIFQEGLLGDEIGAVAPGLENYAKGPLADLWARPALSPRDRSIVTVSALVASGQVAQIPYHLNRAMDNGLTQAQAAEAMAQLAFYAGWPNVFSAMPVAKEVFEKRGR